MKHHSSLLVLLSAIGLTVFASCGRENAHGDLPLWHGQERRLRYLPDGEYFVNRNGDKRFTRAIYGTNTGFRFETSDYPEIGLYMPRLGGSVYMAVETPDTTVWVKDLALVESRFRSGERVYVLEDRKLLGKGRITVDMLALSDADGLIVGIEGEDIPEGVRIVAVYGGANNQRFSREGDLGADPADCFYIKPENCKGNYFLIDGNELLNLYGKGAVILSSDHAYENAEALKDLNARNLVAKDAERVRGIFPEGAEIRLADAGNINDLPALLASGEGETNVAVASFPLDGEKVFMKWLDPDTGSDGKTMSEDYEDAREFRDRIAGRMVIDTPDPFINTLGGILAGAEDAVWESPGYLHGAIGWRVPLTGWRASYLGDLLGMHDRARMHFDGYAASQITDVPVTLPHLQDDELHGARSLKKWGTPMYSNGYIGRSPNRTDQMHHYDMNLVYIDELLWHLNWTGDMEYARKVFPVIKRHLAWEKNTFDADGDCLYDAYCCIWASDALQYNGGAVTHSSAYNYRANRMAAEIAGKIGEDPEPYRKEAEGILAAINETLWLQDRGWWAEFKDNMGKGMIHPDAAAWTVYHSIDSDIHDPFKAYQATRYVDNYLPHIPVLADGLDETENYVISTTNWQPYMWSINNVAFAETMHTAYSFWQSGRADEAFKMFKGTILDAMYLGSGPGNVTQVSFYDAARGELYRDFADPVAVGMRAVVQGLFGVLPDLMNGRLVIRPGFPSDWDHASLKTMNMEYGYERRGGRETFEIKPDLQTDGTLVMELPVRGKAVASVKVNGQECGYSVLENSVGSPKIRIEAEAAEKYDVEIVWRGTRPADRPVETAVASGDRVAVTVSGAVELYDPQNALAGAVLSGNELSGIAAGTEGFRTVFVRVEDGAFSYWKPVGINILKVLDIAGDSGSDRLKFSLLNNSAAALTGSLSLNGKVVAGNLTIAPGASASFEFASPQASFGTNRVVFDAAGAGSHEFDVINWNIPVPQDNAYETVDMSGAFNDEVGNIFEYGKYKSPRWPYTTLCVPDQGMGQWCHPNDLSGIDDRGLRANAKGGVFTMPQGIPFRTPSEPGAKNIAFTTLWDNYPDSLSVPLCGKASKAYLLVAGSTYHMQARILNGTLTAEYADGTRDMLELVLPENLIPLDQDIFIDGFAFYSENPRPWRVRLATGEVDTYHADDLGKRMSNDPIYIDGGLATMLDMPLDSDKELVKLTLATEANEVIIGLMGVTLVR